MVKHTFWENKDVTKQQRPRQCFITTLFLRGFEGSLVLLQNLTVMATFKLCAFLLVKNLVYLFYLPLLGPMACYKNGYSKRFRLP